MYVGGVDLDGFFVLPVDMLYLYPVIKSRQSYHMQVDYISSTNVTNSHVGVLGR